MQNAGALAYASRTVGPRAIKARHRMNVLCCAGMRCLGILQFCLVGVVICIGCGGDADTQQSRRPRDPGQPEAGPSLRTLPADDLDPRRFTPVMSRAWEYSQEALALKAPDFPTAPTSAEWNAWSERVFQPWLQKKQTLVVGARRELDMAATESMRQRIMAGAIVGLLYEDLAHVLLAVPMPKAILEEEPDIVEAFKQVVEGQARPYLEHSRAAYSACKQNAASGRGGLPHWSEYCKEREARLPRSRP